MTAEQTETPRVKKLPRTMWPVRGTAGLQPRPPKPFSSPLCWPSCSPSPPPSLCAQTTTSQGHTPVLVHIIPSAGKMPGRTGPISTCALSRQAKLCRVYAQQDAPSRAESEVLHSVRSMASLKRGADIYTRARGQWSTRFSEEQNWEATVRQGKLLSSRPFDPTELGEYLVSSL